MGARENAFSVRPSPQNQRTPIPPPPNDFKTRADVWEKANLQKIHRRYEKIKSKILSWETEQKTQAKLHLERKVCVGSWKSVTVYRLMNIIISWFMEQQNLMDPTTRAVEQQRYQNKIARVDMIARTAKAQLEEKRRKEESQVRETAKQIRETGRVPVKCFCCFIF
ncbi:remorin 4.1-like [Neltuma alba]|uniref:remorin 4.1-like n=1 Tax=Neltuma alba TaxID=207710 RepID=UPI0010A33CF2|nr:remorin 4.1-like [Prosopis alba]